MPMITTNILFVFHLLKTLIAHVRVRYGLISQARKFVISVGLVFTENDILTESRIDIGN